MQARTSGELQAWCVWSISNAGKDQAGSGHLTAEELDRASRFAFELYKIQNIKAREIPGGQLGGNLKVDSAEIRFSFSAYSKPELTGRVAARLRFNFTRAGDREATWRI